MPATKLATLLRRLGLAYVLTLLLQVRIDGRPVLLGLQALVFVALLWPLRQVAGSPEAQRAWTAAFGSAVVGVAVGAAALIPAVEPGVASLVGSILLVSGTISYTSLLSHWAHRSGWDDLRAAFDRARAWLAGSLVGIGAAVALLIVLVDRRQPGEPADPTQVLLGRVVDGWGAFVVVIAVSVVWVAGAILLQVANRRARKGLVDQGDRTVVLA